MDKILFYKIKDPYGEFSNFLPLDLLIMRKYTGRLVSITFKQKNLSLYFFKRKLGR